MYMYSINHFESILRIGLLDLDFFFHFLFNTYYCLVTQNRQKYIAMNIVSCIFNLHPTTDINLPFTVVAMNTRFSLLDILFRNVVFLQKVNGLDQSKCGAYLSNSFISLSTRKRQTWILSYVV